MTSFVLLKENIHIYPAHGDGAGFHSPAAVTSYGLQNSPFHVFSIKYPHAVWSAMGRP